MVGAAKAVVEVVGKVVEVAVAEIAGEAAAVGTLVVVVVGLAVYDTSFPG